METERPLTTKQVASRLGRSEGWVRMLLISGRLPGRKHGRAWMVDAADVERYQMLRDAGEGVNGN